MLIIMIASMVHFQMVLQNKTDITSLINNSLNQQIGNETLRTLMTRYKILSSEIDMREKPMMRLFHFIT